MNEQKPQDIALEDWKKNNSDFEQKTNENHPTLNAAPNDEVAVGRMLMILIAAVFLGGLAASPFAFYAAAQTGFDVVTPEGKPKEQLFTVIAIIVWIVVTIVVFKLMLNIAKKNSHKV